MNLKMPFPKEHGVWGMTLMPCLSACIALESFNLAVVFFILSAVFFNLGRYPLVQIAKNWAKTEKNYRFLFFWSIIYFSLSLVFFLPVIISENHNYLIVFLIIPIFFLALNLYQTKVKVHRKIRNEIIGISSITITGSVVYYLLSHEVQTTLIELWLCSSVFFAGTIFYIKSKMVGKPYHKITLLYFGFSFLITILWSLWRYETPILSLIFLPVLIKSIIAFVRNQEKKIPINKVGMIVSIHSVIFAVLLGWLLSRLTG